MFMIIMVCTDKSDTIRLVKHFVRLVITTTIIWSFVYYRTNIITRVGLMDSFELIILNSYLRYLNSYIALISILFSF